MPDSPNAYHTISHLILQTILSGRYHNYPPFIDREIEVLRDKLLHPVSNQAHGAFMISCKLGAYRYILFDLLEDFLKVAIVVYIYRLLPASFEKLKCLAAYLGLAFLEQNSDPAHTHLRM